MADITAQPTTLPLRSTDTPITMTRRKPPINGFRIFTYVVLTLAAIVYILPFVFMLGKSVMNQFEATNTPRIVPTQVHLENYLDVLVGSQHYALYLWNTVKLELLTVTGQTVIAILAAYGFARMRFPGRDLLFGLLLLKLFVPAAILLVPNLVLVTDISKAFQAINPSLKWIDNWPSLVIPFLANTFSIFLLRQFFMQIPDELWDAAQIDGAGHLRFLFQIAVPIARPAVLTTILLSVIGIWNVLEWPLLVTSSEDWRPVAVALQQFRNDGGTQIQLMMAASVVALLPILVLYFFTQKQFTAGIATTGLK